MSYCLINIIACSESVLAYPYFIPYQEIRAQQAEANLLQAEANKAESQAMWGTPDVQYNTTVVQPAVESNPQPQINNYNTITVSPYSNNSVTGGN